MGLRCGIGFRDSAGAGPDVRLIDATSKIATMQAAGPAPVLISGLAAKSFASRRQAVPVAPADGAVLSQQPLALPAVP